MMLRLRPVLALILAMVLATASVGMAVAHGQPPMSQWIEICGDGDGVAEYVGADGRPVVMIHLCPECTAAAAALDLPSAPALPLPPMGQASRLTPGLAKATVNLTLPPARARGPPLSV